MPKRAAAFKTLIAIPAFNEEASIGAVLKDLRDHHPLEHVVVIDDGSRDATSQIALAAGVRVIRHPINLGVGAAMGTAFRYAARHNYQALVQVDADGQHRPEFLSLLLDQVGSADIVIGSRFANGANSPAPGPAGPSKGSSPPPFPRTRNHASRMSRPAFA